MAYTSRPDFSHDQPLRTGVLLTNLGTPEAPERGPLRRYLKQFLSDPRVVEVPRPLWWLILNGVILNIRPGRSAASYRTIWTEEGSPLLIHTRNQCEKVRARLVERFGDAIRVEFAMRYGQPSIDGVLDQMMNDGVNRLLVLPLYPQYSAATSASTFDALAADLTRRRWIPELRFVTQYHDHPDYIAAVAQSIEQHWQTHERADLLILSYHGVPKRYLTQGDPYHCQCHVTSRLVAERLGLEAHEYRTTFQSRFGREEWLTPYTDKTLMALPAEGTRSVQVVCPGFSSDCLETLEEICVENREYFLEAGGQRFEYIDALNATEPHIDVIESLIDANLGGWTMEADQTAERQRRAMALGADR